VVGLCEDWGCWASGVVVWLWLACGVRNGS
jgi:hypothetical protein